jgi:quinol monooxygenase YgiN
MIVVTSRMIVRPEAQEEFLKTLRGMLEPTRVEPGCTNYSFYQDIENKNAFILVEEWETKADLDSHIHKESYRKLLALMDLLSGPPEIKINTVSHRAGLEYVEDLRLKSNRR